MTPPTGPVNMRFILGRRLRVQGFIVFDYADRYQEAVDDLGRWLGEGRLTMREDVREGGVDAYVDVLNLLFTGGNHGKLVLRT
jgi:NADPH-dependent curcumin reductase CurA